MHKAFTILFVGLLFMSCERDKVCSLMDYIYTFPEQTAGEVAYRKIYANENDFTKGEHGIKSDSLSENQIVLPAGRESIPFIDIRYPDGTNSWSNQAELGRLAQKMIESTGCKATFSYTDYAVLKSTINSSPTYLHLTLHDQDQDGGEKMWLIDRIYDEDKVDVTERPEWQCVRALTFTFYKGGKGARVKMNAPTDGNACGFFEELFGEKSEVFATYSLEGQDQKELRITVPAVSDALKEQLTFQVLASDYDQISISLTNSSSQIGYATLIPSNHD
ncbi:hypothetical protein RYH73_15060 [Olivibacter sp. CPCC 100613]|uniref:hypothetical protein n=1 Tax=Olivibacter sp. CPCC 100613 TaxID=3079931 RepID=UPI002FF66789